MINPSVLMMLLFGASIGLCFGGRDASSFRGIHLTIGRQTASFLLAFTSFAVAIMFGGGDLLTVIPLTWFWWRSARSLRLHCRYVQLAREQGWLIGATS